MATSETMGKHNQFEIVTEADQHGTAKSYGKHTIPRPNVQQTYARSSKKEDENHLIFRREDEKENDTETTGTGDDGEVRKYILTKRVVRRDFLLSYLNEPKISFDDFMNRLGHKSPKDIHLQNDTIKNHIEDKLMSNMYSVLLCLFLHLIYNFSRVLYKERLGN